MNFIISIIRTLFRHRWLILVGTAIFTLLVFYYTHRLGDSTKFDGQPDKYHASREHPEKSIPAIICPCTYPGKSGQ